MDKDILRQYTSLKKEILFETKRIKKMEDDINSAVPADREITDVVTKGKRGKKSLGSVVISGIGDQTSINRKRARLRERKAKQELRLAKIEILTADAEDYINNIPDSETRIIMRLFFLEGKTWNEVAKAMGAGYTGEACKKKVQRELNKK